MTSRPTTSVTTDLELRLLIPGARPIPVEARLQYDSADPYAVHVGFRTGGDEVVAWSFARQLLTEGVHSESGHGDVRVWPSAGENDASGVCLSLSSPSGSAQFEAPRTGLIDFLAQTYAVVPTGRESDHVDLDAELALLLWSGAQD
jgi:hypothetical protein